MGPEAAPMGWQREGWEVTAGQWIGADPHYLTNERQAIAERAIVEWGGTTVAGQYEDDEPEQILIVDSVMCPRCVDRAVRSFEAMEAGAAWREAMLEG